MKKDRYQYKVFVMLNKQILWFGLPPFTAVSTFVVGFLLLGVIRLWAIPFLYLIYHILSFTAKASRNGQPNILTNFKFMLSEKRQMEDNVNVIKQLTRKDD